MKRTTISLVLLVVLAAWTIVASAQTAPVTLTGPKWNLIEVKGVAVKDANAYIRFDAVKKNTYYGSNNCDFIGGRYKADDTNLTFFQSFVTRHVCHEPEAQRIEKEFSKVFYSTTRFWIWEDTLRLYKGDEIVLVFKASPGKPE